jgi:hypothetical protein
MKGVSSVITVSHRPTAAVLRGLVTGALSSLLIMSAPASATAQSGSSASGPRLSEWGDFGVAPQLGRTGSRIATPDTLLRSYLGASSGPDDGIPTPGGVNPLLLSASGNLFGPAPANFSARRESPAAARATSLEFRLLDRPISTAIPEPAQEQQDSVWRDASGQPKNIGLGIAEAYLGNFIPWAFNEIVPSRRELKISQISPRSWWRNIENGWEWDDNAFQVNHFAHPFQGGIYYNAGRSNGFGYWTSLLFATAGSFNWECCGETHFMSINDWVNTSLGGAAMGEMLYRTSSMVLDNQATGRERTLREIGAFLLAPTRGFTRLVTGNATRVYDNPVHPNDRIPDIFESLLAVGIRGTNSTRRASGGELEDDTPAHGFFDFELTSGGLMALERQKPFDFFHFNLQVNFVKGRGLGELNIRGNLWHKDLTENDRGISKLIVVQDFDYENNMAFEQGGQGVSLMYAANRQLTDRSDIFYHAAGSWLIMGGVKSELAFLAEVEGIRERFREYDFGLGPGFRGGFDWRFDGKQILRASYRLQYVHTLNGSNREGYGSNHTVQIVRVRAQLPWEYAGFSIGGDFEGFRRKSNFDFAEIGQVRQTARLWQVFLSYNPRQGRN